MTIDEALLFLDSVLKQQHLNQQVDRSGTIADRAPAELRQNLYL